VGIVGQGEPHGRVSDLDDRPDRVLLMRTRGAWWKAAV
jgi:hypothetical protein